MTPSARIPAAPPVMRALALGVESLTPLAAGAGAWPSHLGRSGILAHDAARKIR
jgi:hypothetical protein